MSPHRDKENSQASLLLYAPVPLYRLDGQLHIEIQAVNGLRLWARHFDPVTVMMPCCRDTPPKGWVPVTSHLQDLVGVEIEPVPMAYRPDQFARALVPTLGRIKRAIAKADYLSFAIGGLFGDWGAVSSLAAHRMRRPFAAWTDRVEAEVMRQSQFDPQGNWRSRLRARLYHRPMALLERMVIHRADLGLLHGAETYLRYRDYCRNPHLVHDIHISERDHIDAAGLARKINNARAGKPLRLVYAGRAVSMKGPADWIQVLERLQRLGVDFRATWLGDGEAMPGMQDQLCQAGLTDRVGLPGFVEDRHQVLKELRRADLFLFCHKTPESPRCLIEALTSGTPILGYEGAYARDVISAHGGGLLVARGDTEALAKQIVRLDADRGALADLMALARADGAPFSDTRVFAHRAQLLKRHLPEKMGQNVKGQGSGAAGTQAAGT